MLFGLLIFALACQVETEKDTSEIEGRPPEQPSSEPATEPILPDDVDSDGFSEEDGDCDDWDPAINPDAEEVLNGLDDDCNGWIDQDGLHEGSGVFVSTAVYQSVVYNFSDQCNVNQLYREAGVFEFEAYCSIDTSQPESLRLLGTAITITAEDNIFGEEEWSGRGVIQGTGGDTDWDTTIELSILWPSLESGAGALVQVEGDLNTFYLDGVFSVDLLRTE